MLTGVETAELLTQQAWQHGDDPLHQVYTCGPGLGLLIQCTALPAPQCPLPSASRVTGELSHSAMHRCKMRLSSSDNRQSQPSREAHCLVEHLVLRWTRRRSVAT